MSFRQGARQFFERRGTPAWTNPYVTDGLIAMWDGEWNAGGGIHDANATVWKDLVGNRDLGLYSASFNNNSLYRSNESATGYMAYVEQTSPIWVVKTFEFCCDLSYSGWMVPFSVQTRDSNGAWISSISARSSKGGGTLECISARNWTKYPKPFSGGNLKGTLCVQWDGANGVWTVGAYFNGTELIEDPTLPSAAGNYARNSIALGSNSLYNLTGSIYSARAYSRAITAEVIAANYAIDKARFNLP